MVGGQEGVGESFLADRGVRTVARMQNLFVSQGKHFSENALHERFIGSPGQVGAPNGSGEDDVSTEDMFSHLQTDASR